jgi:hypothetical protein
MKRLDLLVLGGEVRTRVAQEVDQLDCLPPGLVVAKSPMVTSTAAAPSRLRSCATRLLTSRSRVRERLGRLRGNVIRPIPMPSSSEGPYRPAVQRSPRRVDHRGIEQLRPEDLVPLGYPFVEVGLQHTASMTSVYSCDKRFKPNSQFTRASSLRSRPLTETVTAECNDRRSNASIRKSLRASRTVNLARRRVPKSSAGPSWPWRGHSPST